MRSRNLISAVSERLLEVAPELVGVLEPDREPQQTRWHALALPAFPCLDPGRDAAEARRVRDQRRRRSRRAARSPRRRRRTRGARRSPDSERSATAGWPRSRSASSCARLRLARHPHLERLQAAEEEPGSVGGRDGPGARAELEQSRGVLGSLATTAPTSASSWPARYFVAEWTTKSQPSSSGRRCSGVAAVASQTTRAGWAAAASKSGIVRNGFDGASSQTRSTPSGGGAGLVELDLAEAPARELVEHDAGAVVGAFGERDRLPGREQREHDRRARRRARGEEERLAAVERAELSLGLGERRAREARVVNAPGSPSSYGQVVERSIGVGTHGGEAITGPRVRLRAMAEIHDTTEAKLRWLQELREEALAPGEREGTSSASASAASCSRASGSRSCSTPARSSSSTASSATARSSSGCATTGPWGDAVVTGYGTIFGRKVFVFSQDFTVFGGSLSEVFAEKICKVMDLAVKYGCPVIGINDSGGARIQEGVVSLAGYAEIFWRNVQASGVVPQISLVMGPCAGGAVYSPAITDFVLMVEGTSYMFITGPDVVKTVTGEEVTLRGARRRGDARDAVGRRALHRRRTRRRASRTRATCSRSCRRTTSTRRRTRRRPIRSTARTRSSTRSSPTARTSRTTSSASIERVVDDGEFLEVHAHWAENIVCGFARLGGHSVGVVGNQPRSARRRARHRRVGEGGALRPHLRRVQHPARHVRRRAGLPARDGAGVGRDHPPRREAALRLRRGDRAEADRDHAQGVRRRVRRHELEAHPRRLQRRLADRRGRGDGAGGRGQHRLPQRSSRRRTTRRRGATS